MDLAECFLQITVNFIQKCCRAEPILLWPDKQRQIFSHVTALNSTNTHFFKRLSEINQCLIAVNFTTLNKATGPSKY